MGRTKDISNRARVGPHFKIFTQCHHAGFFSPPFVISFSGFDFLPVLCIKLELAKTESYYPVPNTISYEVRSSLVFELMRHADQKKHAVFTV